MKVFIGGTGRAGTSFLVQLLTRLGFDTGFVPEGENFNPSWRAGCEILVNTTRHQLKISPDIIKSPTAFPQIAKHMDIINFDLFICPIRNIESVVRSRVKTGRMAGDGKMSLKEYLLDRFYESMYLCSEHDIDVLFLNFPRIVKDSDYCYKKLSKHFDIDKKKFNKVYNNLAKPEMILF